MGYNKWGLSQGDKYQYAFARYRVAMLLEAHASQIGGPVAFGVETPVEGWDDIAEFSTVDGHLSVIHYQVKRQYSNFKAGDLAAVFQNLFKTALEILQKTDPYNGFSVPAESRKFVFVFPTPDLKVGKIGISQLKSLLENCTNDSAARTIVSNKGQNLDKSQCQWLAEVRKAAGSPEMCRQVLSQMSVQILPEAILDEQASALFAKHYDIHDLVKPLLDDILRNSPPEGLLDVEELLEKLAQAGPKRELQHISLGQDLKGCFIHHHERQSDITNVAGSIVKKVWQPHDAVVLHVCYQPPDDSMPLRLACVRLLLHANLSPVYVSGRCLWWERCKTEVAGTVGYNECKGALEEGHFKEKAVPKTLPPKTTWLHGDFGASLQNAMDDFVWECVLEEGKCLLSSIVGVPFEKQANSMRHLAGFFNHVLHGWWGEEKGASGVARAGPKVARNVAEIILAIAILEKLGHKVTAPDDAETIGMLGNLSVRALAIKEVGGIDDKLKKPVKLDDCARDLLACQSVVLISCNVDDIYRTAKMPPFGETGEGTGIQEWTASAFLINPESLISAIKRSECCARSLIDSWREQRSRHNSDALNAELEKWNENCNA
ncbi:MAG: hypothetical protein CVU65_11610 [Deltaproteobacteria bacterium HGW-Deltaproteobacteria-22]|nr:MAG: hypothetical protein CVU65_11610 [Deltaproteobacteria bacterium HGW-Deltaproteobacteria-22]